MWAGGPVFRVAAFDALDDVDEVLVGGGAWMPACSPSRTTKAVEEFDLGAPALGHVLGPIDGRWIGARPRPTPRQPPLVIDLHARAAVAPRQARAMVSGG